MRLELLVSATILNTAPLLTAAYSGSLSLLLIQMRTLRALLMIVPIATIEGTVMLLEMAVSVMIICISGHQKSVLHCMRAVSWLRETAAFLAR